MPHCSWYAVDTKINFHKKKKYSFNFCGNEDIVKHCNEN